MERTPRRERNLPDYTRGEEITNMVTHIVGAALSLPFCPLTTAIPGRSSAAASTG